jgi:hypothetical protein
MYWAPLMRDSGINTSFNSAGAISANQVAPTQPQSIGCPSLPTTYDSRLDAVLTQWNFYQEIDVGIFDSPALNPGSFINNTGGFNRQTCVKNGIADRKATGRVVRFSGEDEIMAILGSLRRTAPGLSELPALQTSP